MVGPGRNWTPPAEEWPAVQHWHDVRDVVIEDRRLNRDGGKFGPGTMLQEQPAKVGVREETTDSPGRQQWNKGPTIKGAILSEGEDIRQVPRKSSDWKLCSEQSSFLAGLVKRESKHCKGVGSLRNGRRDQSKQLQTPGCRSTDNSRILCLHDAEKKKGGDKPEPAATLFGSHSGRAALR
jgi:hypothetical protein